MENIALVSSVDLPIQSTTAEMTSQKPKKLSPLPTVNPKTGGVSNKDGNQPTLGVKFISAGLAACVADLVTFPLDTAKVRLQIQGEGTAAAAPRALHPTSFLPSSQSTFNIASQRTFTTVVASAAAEAPKYRGVVNTIYVISQEEGVRALYNGLVPGLQRQMAFASIRIGLYDAVKQGYIDLFRANGLVSENNVGLRILAGITTGAAAVTCAQPTDVVKVRLQAQSKGPKRYSGTINAYKTIGAHEGVKGLWKGTLPNITRNGIVNAAELVSYDLIKEAILRRRLLTDNMPCHFVSAFGAGFCTTVVASPVDVVKTRYMNSAKGVYRGAFHCATTMFKEGGVFTFYKGFMPSFLRLGSWNIVMFVTFEQLKRLFSRLNSDEQISVKAPQPVTEQSNSQRYL